MDAIPTPVNALSGVFVILLVDYLSQHRGWGWLRLAQGATALKGTPGLLFAKVMGSGHNGGFSLRPSSSHQGLLCLFSHQREAEAFIRGPQVQAYVQRARESWMGLFGITSSRGSWDQQTWGVTPESSLFQPLQASAPMAALTRASIRPVKAMSFWRHAPAAQSDLNQAPGCQLAMGLGEAPLIRQCTFSLWDDTESMYQYAHSGAHQQAIQAAYKQEFFSESMFVRMRGISMSGQWQGRTITHPAGYPHV